MSTFEAKVAVVTDFLVNRASLARVTNLKELGEVAGALLHDRQLRHVSTPVRRDKLKDVLRAVDAKSYADKGVLLSAVVVHFWDNAPGSTFFTSAAQQGVNTYNEGPAVAAAHKDKAFKVYGADGAVDVNANFTAPDDAHELDEVYQARDPFTAQDSNGGVHELVAVAEALAQASAGLQAYVGKHRN